MHRRWHSVHSLSHERPSSICYGYTVLPSNLLPIRHPIRLSRRSTPFDSLEFIYELKIDGFRALAHIAAGRGELVLPSRLIRPVVL